MALFFCPLSEPLDELQKVLGEYHSPQQGECNHQHHPTNERFWGINNEQITRVDTKCEHEKLTQPHHETADDPKNPMLIHGELD